MLETVDLTPTLTKDEYAARRQKVDQELFDLVRRAKAGGVPVIAVFEGLETAGKGRAIFTLTEKLDPRTVIVIPVRAKPRSYERERPWMWRFWMKTPARGEMAVFDTSWYGRVLADRIDQVVPKKEWRAAYEEIEAFERQLVDDGAILVKFWLHVDEKEQKRRIKKLAKRGAKVQLRRARAQHEAWDAWIEAAEEMLARTSTAHAPWTIVASNDQRWARIKIFDTVIDEMRRVLDARGVPALPAPESTKHVETKPEKTTDHEAAALAASTKSGATPRRS